MSARHSVRLAMLASGAALAMALVPTTTTFAAPAGAATNAGRVGAQPQLLDPPPGEFHQTCTKVTTATFDPILDSYPHSHEFFGNKGVNINSTPASLRMSPAGTSCDRSANKSAYWVPSLYVPTHRVIDPFVRIDPKFTRSYYLTGGIDDPSTIVNFPANLMMIAGNSMWGPAQPPQSTDVVNWTCKKDSGAESEENAIPTDCAGQNMNGDLRLRVMFPNCWDGQSAGLDNRAAWKPHLKYAWDDGGTDDGACDPPDSEFAWVPIPQLRLGVQWDISAYKTDLAGAYIASDVMMETDRGRTAHGDFMNGWNQSALEDLIAYCIRGDWQPDGPQDLPPDCNTSD